MKKGFALQWHITEKCDQRCKHCYIYGGEDCNLKKDLSINEMAVILQNFVDFCNRVNKYPVLSITGGDPLLYENVWEFLELVKSYGIKFHILGNPFHLNDEVASRLKELGCTHYQMSLDGLEKTHDAIRMPGSYKATLSKIKCLKNAGIIATIMSTVSKMNMEELPDLVDVVVENNVDRFAFARYCPNPGDEDMMPSPLEYKDFFEKMWSKYEKYKDSSTLFSLKEHLWTLFLYEKGLFNIEDIQNKDNLILDGCHCGICHMTLLTDGTVYACRRSETPIGNVPDQSFYDIFFGNEMEKYRQYDSFEACSKCELLCYCRGCPSVANCSKGNFYAKDPQCWKEV